MSSYYAQQAWANGSGGNTPVTAETLEHIEQGIDGAHDRIDALAVGIAMEPTPIRTSTVPPAAGQVVTYDATAGSIGPIPLPNPQAGVMMGMVKGDSTSNTITFSSSNLQGNGGASTFTLRTLGESRTLYGSAAGAWFVAGLQSPVIGTGPGTVAAGNDSRFANTLATYVYGAPGRTYAPICEVFYVDPPYAVPNYDLYAGGGWVPIVDPDDLLGTVGAFSVINIPITGRYEVHFNGAAATNTPNAPNGNVNIRVTRNQASYAGAVATDSKPTGNGIITLSAYGTPLLNEGDQLYWSVYCSPGTTMTFAGYGGGSIIENTRVTVRYLGPR